MQYESSSGSGVSTGEESQNSEEYATTPSFGYSENSYSSIKQKCDIYCKGCNKVPLVFKPSEQYPFTLCQYCNFCNLKEKLPLKDFLERGKENIQRKVEFCERPKKHTGEKAKSEYYSYNWKLNLCNDCYNRYFKNENSTKSEKLSDIRPNLNKAAKKKNIENFIEELKKVIGCFEKFKRLAEFSWILINNYYENDGISIENNLKFEELNFDHGFIKKILDEARKNYEAMRGVFEKYEGKTKEKFPNLEKDDEIFSKKYEIKKITKIDFIPDAVSVQTSVNSLTKSLAKSNVTSNSHESSKDFPSKIKNVVLLQNEGKNLMAYSTSKTIHIYDISEKENGEGEHCPVKSEVNFLLPLTGCRLLCCCKRSKLPNIFEINDMKLTEISSPFLDPKMSEMDVINNAVEIKDDLIALSSKSGYVSTWRKNSEGKYKIEKYIQLNKANFKESASAIGVMKMVKLDDNKIVLGEICYICYEPAKNDESDKNDKNDKDAKNDGNNKKKYKIKDGIVCCWDFSSPNEEVCEGLRFLECNDIIKLKEDLILVSTQTKVVVFDCKNNRIISEREVGLVLVTCFEFLNSQTLLVGDYCGRLQLLDIDDLKNLSLRVVGNLHGEKRVVFIRKLEGKEEFITSSLDEIFHWKIMPGKDGLDTKDRNDTLSREKDSLYRLYK